MHPFMRGGVKQDESGPAGASHAAGPLSLSIAALALSLAALAILLIPVACHAADEAAEAEKLEHLTVHPMEIVLPSARAQVQMVVTGTFADGEVRDLTRAVKYIVTDPGIVAVEGGRAVPIKDGATHIEVRVGMQTVRVPATVSGQKETDRVRFRSEVLAVLTKQGCNAGSCHGAPEGKGGFALSMLAYAPHVDEESLIRGGLGRRTEPIDPEESLLLKKPMLRMTHVGGKRLRRTDVAYRILHDWIYEGAQADSEDAPQCTGITIDPSPSRVLRLPGAEQQLRVVARFSDGSERDVTPIATFDASNKDLLACDAAGLVRGKQRGVAAITVRYLSHVQSVYFTVVENVEGFVWSNPAEAGYIDRLVHAKLRQLQYLPGEMCDDSTFLRRVSLDLTGLLPTVERARVFLADEAPDKRARLIDDLLASEECARFQGLLTADLMRVNNAVLKDGRAELFGEWLCDSWRRNQPFDQFAREILTATGDTKTSGPANYFLAIPTNEDLAETTAQLFMGSRINCAKCHNHPFENWTQNDYYRIAAVFVRTRKEGDTIALSDSGEAMHPATGAAMRPWGNEGAAEAAPVNADRRQTFTQWLTRRGNPFFARAEVNRLWARLMGRGIVHPVDDFRSSNPPGNPELLDALAADFEQSGYDRRHILRTICNSRAYQRSAATNRFNADDAILFSHYVPRRMTAEQLQDAIGFVTRTLPLVAACEAERMQKQMELEMLVGKLAQDRPAWEASLREKLVATRVWLGGWRYAGPFVAPSYEEAIATAFPPEAEPGLAAAGTGKFTWQVHPEWEDAKQHRIASDAIGAHYLHRRVVADHAARAVFSFGSDDGLKVWLNGKVILDKPQRRGLKENDDRVEIDLSAGENTLLLKVSNSGGFCGFYFQLVSFDGQPPEKLAVPAAIAESVVTPAEKRSTAMQQALVTFHEGTIPQVPALRQQLQKLTRRMEYQTQRPAQDQSDFLRAFGQPKRESACACERSSEPTIDQALQILNGALVSNKTAHGAAEYARITGDAPLVEELYLAALARLPTDKERTISVTYLQQRPNHNDAVQDLLWALLNTQEFLFQH